MIESLRLRNFKCFRDQKVPLGALTVLAGINGAGKSSVIQAILALHQWWEDLQGTPNPWRGPLVNLGSFRDVLHEGSDDDMFRIDARFSDGGTAYYEQRPARGGGQMGRSSRDVTDAYPRDLFYLSADRLGPRPTLPYVEGERAEVTPLGKRGEHVLWYLSRIGSVPVHPAVRHSSEAKNTLTNQANAWLGVVSPGAALEVRAIPEADCAVATYRYERPADVPSRPFRAANVGFGVSYALPPIVALLAPKQDRRDSRGESCNHREPRGPHPSGRADILGGVGGESRGGAVRRSFSRHTAIIY